MACRHGVMVAVIVTALGGCAGEVARPDARPANQGDASWHAVEQPDTVHYSLALGEVSSGGTAFQRVTPLYPPGELRACPPVVEVTAKMLVDARGRVTEVRPGNAASGTPDLQPFLAATRAAALQWQFNPLQINRWSADANGESHVIDSRLLPFSLDYVFRFTCRAGKAGVSPGDAVPSTKAG